MVAIGRCDIKEYITDVSGRYGHSWKVGIISCMSHCVQTSMHQALFCPTRARVYNSIQLLNIALHVDNYWFFIIYTRPFPCMY